MIVTNSCRDLSIGKSFQAGSNSAGARGSSAPCTDLGKAFDGGDKVGFVAGTSTVRLVNIVASEEEVPVRKDNALNRRHYGYKAALGTQHAFSWGLLRVTLRSRYC